MSKNSSSPKVLVSSGRAGRFTPRNIGVSIIAFVAGSALTGVGIYWLLKHTSAPMATSPSPTQEIAPSSISSSSATSESEKAYGWADTYWGMPLSEIRQKYPDLRQLSREEVAQFTGHNSSEFLDDLVAKYDFFVIPVVNAGTPYRASAYLYMEKTDELQRVILKVDVPDVMKLSAYKDLEPRLINRYGASITDNKEGFRPGFLVPDPDWSVHQEWVTDSTEISLFVLPNRPVAIYYERLRQKL